MTCPACRGTGESPRMGFSCLKCDGSGCLCDRCGEPAIHVEPSTEDVCDQCRKDELDEEAPGGN